MDYADHLNYKDFEIPVCFRVEPVNDVNALIPTHEISEEVFVDNYGMKRGETFDVALFANESKAEFAFDGKNVDKDGVIEDVKNLIEKYNDPPEQLEIEAQKEYEEMNVEVTDITVKES